jgi:drug/metabolite transporter (DMT)-like permease
VSPRLLGTVLALVSAAGFGIMPVLTKVAYDDGTSVAGLLAVRFLLASLVLLALARWRGEALPRGRQALQLFLLGAVGYVIESACYFAALTRISAGLTALLLYAYPALVVLLAAVVTRRRPSRVATTCVLVATVGTALTIGPVAGGQWTGVLLGLSAAVSYATYILVSSRAVVGVGPFATSAVVMGGAGLVYGGYALSTRAALPSTTGAWWAVLGVALLGTVVAVAAFFWALDLLGPADTAVISTFEPVVSVVAAAVFLSESLTAVQVIGGALVLSAVAVLARSPGTGPAVPLDVG